MEELIKRLQDASRSMPTIEIMNNLLSEISESKDLKTLKAISVLPGIHILFQSQARVRIFYLEEFQNRMDKHSNKIEIYVLYKLPKELYPEDIIEAIKRKSLKGTQGEKITLKENFVHIVKKENPEDIKLDINIKSLIKTMFNPNMY